MRYPQFVKLFRATDEEILSLKEKYCDPCKVCKGTRKLVTESKGPYTVSPCICLGKFTIAVQLAHANIPVLFRDLTKDDIDKQFREQNANALGKTSIYSKKLAKAVNEGVGLFMSGSKGSGKSFIASLILKRVLKEGYSAYFILLKDLVNAAFQSLSDNEARADLQTLITQIDFLVIDEFDRINDSSEMVLNLLSALFKQRCYSRKPLIITSNKAFGKLDTTITPMFEERLLKLSFQGNYRSNLGNRLEQEFFTDGN